MIHYQMCHLVEHYVVSDCKAGLSKVIFRLLLNSQPFFFLINESREERKVKDKFTPVIEI